MYGHQAWHGAQLAHASCYGNSNFCITFHSFIAIIPNNNRRVFCLSVVIRQKSTHFSVSACEHVVCVAHNGGAANDCKSITRERTQLHAIEFSEEDSHLSSATVSRGI